jgi:hypothetical protein
VTTYPRFAVLVLASLGLAATGCQLPVFFPEFVVNTSNPGYNYSDGVAIGEDGDFIVIWGEDGDVVGRRFDPLTVPLGNPFPVSATPPNPLLRSSIARDAQGRFVVVWAEEITSIWGRRFEADGTPLGGDFPVNTSTPLYTYRPHVASDPSGNFVVAWTAHTGADSSVMARRFDSNGAPLGDEFQVNLFDDGGQESGGVAMSPAGFVVTWAGQGSGTSLGIFARLFDAAGSPLTDDLHVQTGPLTAAGAGEPDVAMNANGDFVVVWDEPDGTVYTVKGRRWNVAGSPAGAVFPISEGTLGARDPHVASDSAGNFLVAWRGMFDPPEGPDAPAAAAGFPVPIVAVRLYDIGGFSVSSQFAVNDFTTDDKSRPRPSLTDDGSFVVAWTSGYGFEYDVKARKTGARAAPEITVDPPLEVGSSPMGGSLGNRVFEAGETLVPRTAWVNDTGADVLSVAGSAPLFTGPPGANYTLHDDTALYDTIPAGQTKSCIVSGDCYSVTVSDPAVRPVQHWDALLQETLNLSLPHTWVLHLGESFPDVPTDHQFYSFIETLFHNSVTGGCAGGGYCPGNPVTRAQMAVFLLKSKFGSAHIPPPCTGTVFTDVPCTGGPFDPWIEELAGLEITSGCDVGLYCPDNTVTRQQMAVFLLKTLEGSSYDPPDCNGIFDDVPCTPGTGFSDWIEELFNRGITGGCSMAPPLYCPTNPNNRGQMAVFLVKTFGLVLYGG